VLASITFGVILFSQAQGAMPAQGSEITKGTLTVAGNSGSPGARVLDTGEYPILGPAALTALTVKTPTRPRSTLPVTARRVTATSSKTSPWGKPPKTPDVKTVDTTSPKNTSESSALDFISESAALSSSDSVQSTSASSGVSVTVASTSSDSSASSTMSSSSSSSDTSSDSSSSDSSVSTSATSSTSTDGTSVDASMASLTLGKKEALEERLKEHCAKARHFNSDSENDDEKEEKEAQREFDEKLFGASIEIKDQETKQFSEEIANKLLSKLAYRQLAAYLKEHIGAAETKAVDWVTANVFPDEIPDLSTPTADLVSCLFVTENYLLGSSPRGDEAKKFARSYLIFIMRLALDAATCCIPTEIDSRMLCPKKVFGNMIYIFNYGKNLVEKHGKKHVLTKNVIYTQTVDEVDAWFKKRHYSEFPPCETIALFQPMRSGYLSGFDTFEFTTTPNQSFIKYMGGLSNNARASMRSFRAHFVNYFLSELKKAKDWEEFFQQQQLSLEKAQQWKIKFNSRKQNKKPRSFEV
jgi:hypothetical protein